MNLYSWVFELILLGIWTYTFGLGNHDSGYLNLYFVQNCILVWTHPLGVSGAGGARRGGGGGTAASQRLPPFGRALGASHPGTKCPERGIPHFNQPTVNYQDHSTPYKKQKRKSWIVTIMYFEILEGSHVFKWLKLWWSFVHLRSPLHFRGALPPSASPIAPRWLELWNICKGVHSLDSESLFLEKSSWKPLNSCQTHSFVKMNLKATPPLICSQNDHLNSALILDSIIKDLPHHKFEAIWTSPNVHSYLDKTLLWTFRWHCRRRQLWAHNSRIWPEPQTIGHRDAISPSAIPHIDRSEGFPARDIWSLGVMAQGPGQMGRVLGKPSPPPPSPPPSLLPGGYRP